MQGKVQLDYYASKAIDWPNEQNHFGCGDLEQNQVIQPAFKQVVSAQSNKWYQSEVMGSNPLSDTGRKLLALLVSVALRT